MPTSWIPSPSRAVIGWAEEGLDPARVFLDKSNRLGRGLDVDAVAGRPGETGSFLTMILGWLASFRDL